MTHSRRDKSTTKTQARVGRADASENLDAGLDYWEKTLAESSPQLELPTDRPRRPEAKTYRNLSKRFRVDAALAETLRAYARREKCSVFAVLTAALETLLHRYTGSEDIVASFSPENGEGRAEEWELVHPRRLHALRIRASGEMTFGELLAGVEKGVTELCHHRLPSFDQVVSRVWPNHDPNRPLLQVKIAWRNQDRPSSIIGRESLPLKAGQSEFELSFTLSDGKQGLYLEVEYAADLFDEARMVRMIGHYQTLLASASQDPDQSLGKLSMLTASERQQILVEWNKTSSDYPRDRCVHELIEEQAETRPEAVAAVFHGTQLTYRQLNDRANQLARHLQALGVGPDTLVGICVERSLEMLVGLLGILKAGGAYLPLDPGYPQERLEFMMRDSGAPLLLIQQRMQEKFQADNPRCRIICLDADWGTMAQYPTANTASGVGPGHLAYLIYTSGSTGEPKGVELRHGGLLNLIFWHRNTYRVTPADRSTQLAGVGFDASVWELWPCLTAGASLHLPDEETRLSPEKLREWLVGHEITLSFVPTPLAEALVALSWPAPVALRAMLTGGDRLTCRVPATLPFALVNHYGPTETTVVATCAVIEPERPEGKAPPIGRPLANTQIYILDRHLCPVPVGFTGEIYIGGDGLARGYHNRPELTAEKFIPHPFHDQPKARLYRTGDLARYQPDGAIEFLGRNDDQVKIRGFRIELGEIESVLAAQPGVGAAVVEARVTGPGEKRLIAYLTLRSANVTVRELRAHLKTQMPDYMVPSAFVILDLLPLTPHGKVDRRALPPPNPEARWEDGEFVAPATPTEKVLAGIWRDILGLERIGSNDSFFDLGGHSLLVVQLFERVHRRFEIILPLSTLFEARTLAALAQVIDRAGQPAPDQTAMACRLIPIRSGATKWPLFVIHAGDGNVLSYEHLARHLPEGQAMYGLESRGLRGLPLDYSVPAIARDYIRQIRARQPHGPYYVVGHCFGGAVAYEIARQLTAQHEAMGLVGLLEAFSPNLIKEDASLQTKFQKSGQKRLWCRFGHDLKSLVWGPARTGCMREIRSSLHARWIRTLYLVAYKLSSRFGRKMPRFFKNVKEAIRIASNHYVPGRYNGTVVFFRCRNPIYTDPPDSSRLWQRLVKKGVILEVPGDHNSFLQEPGAQKLAEQILAFMHVPLNSPRSPAHSARFAPNTTDVAPVDHEHWQGPVGKAA